MRWTSVVQKGHNLNRAWKAVWKSKRMQYPDYPLNVPKVLIEKGVEVIDPVAKEEVEKWQPPVDDPRFPREVPLSDKPNYNEEPAFVCTPNTCIHQGVKQASCLAKAQVFEGLPPSVQRLIPTINIDDTTSQLLQRYIMLAQTWNTTREKLPKRIDPRKPGYKFRAEYGIPKKEQAGILIRNLLWLCQSHVCSYPSLGDRRQIYAPYLNSHYLFRGEAVVVRGFAEWLVTDRKPLAPFADEETIDSSVNHPLPSLYPLLPTIDLQQDHIYTLEHNNGLARSDWSHGEPHTLFITDSNHYKQDHRLGRNIIFCLSQAIAFARRKYGNVKSLPEPVCIQCVSLDHQTFNFVCFQLNTLAFDSDNGVKNQVWVDGGNHLFQKILATPWMPKAIRYERYEDFEPSAFQKLLAVYLNGVSEVGGSSV